METTIKNQVRVFRTLGTKRNDPNTYVIQAVDEPNGMILETHKLKEYALSTPPALVFCHLCKDGSNQSQWRQHLESTLNYLFPDDKVYDFKVMEELAAADNGKCRYHVMYEGYKFQFNSKRDISLKPGQVVSFRVFKQMSEERYWFLDFFTVLPKREALEPEAFFKQLGYGSTVYNEFLEADKHFGEMTLWTSQLLAKTRMLVSCNDPLWVMKYIDFLAAQLCQASNDRYSMCPAWHLLQDMLNYVLTDKVYLLNNCTATYANYVYEEYTKLQQRVNCILKAVELCDTGGADYFLTECLRQYAELDKNEIIFRTQVVGQLLTMDKNFGIRNSSNVFYLIKMNRKYGKQFAVYFNGFLYQGIYNSYNSWCSRHLHDEDMDFQVADKIIFGFGCIINDMLQRRVNSRLFSTNVQWLYAQLVQLLCRKLNKNLALELINHTVRLLASGKSPSAIDFNSLKMVEKYPDFLAYSIIRGVQPATDEVQYVDNDSFIAYHDNSLVIGNLPTKYPVLDMHRNFAFQPIPGTAVGVADITKALPGKDATFSEWRFYWSKALGNVSKMRAPYLQNGSHVLIRTFFGNKDKRVNGIVVDTSYSYAIGIYGGGYIKRAYLPDLCPIFQREAFLLHARIVVDKNGLILGNVEQEISSFSRKRAQEVAPLATAVCIGNDRQTRWATFITETGVVAMAKRQPGFCVVIGKAYTIKLDPQGEQNGYPTATIECPIDRKLDASDLLRNQLRAISNLNLAELRNQGHTVCMCQPLRVPTFLLMEYLGLIDDPVVKYNLLQVIRLYSQQLKNEPYKLGVEIQYMEAQACLEEGVSYQSSLPNFVWPAQLKDSLKQFDFEEIVHRCNNELSFNTLTADQWSVAAQRMAY